MIADSEKIALIIDDKKITYNELLKSVTAFSETLINIKPKDRILIWAENNEYWIYAFLSIWHQNAIPVPLNNNANQGILHYAINTCLPKYAFVSQKNVEVLKSIIRSLDNKPEIIVIDDYKNVAIYNKLPANIKFKSEDTALITFTAGTTSFFQKPVMSSFANIFFNINAYLEINLFSTQDRFLVILSFDHMFPLLNTLILPLYIGAIIVFPSSLNPKDILKTLKNNKVTVITGVPAVVKNIHNIIMSEINASKLATFLYKLSKKLNNLFVAKLLFRGVYKKIGNSIRFIVCRGIKLDENIYKGFNVLGIEILEGYGMIESSVIAFSRLNHNKIGSVGKKVEGTQIKILDGEIVVRSPCVMQGYYNLPALTSKVLSNGWLSTGDLGTIDSEGYLRILGRKDELILMPNGKKVNPYEIEYKLEHYSEFVKEVGVFEEKGKLYALIVINVDSYDYLTDKKYKEIKEYNEIRIKNSIKWEVIDEYNQMVSEYKRIKEFYIITDNLPRNQLGKLKRYELHKLFKSKEKDYYRLIDSIENQLDIVENNEKVHSNTLI